MLLNELFESDTKHVTFCFGRMNPPTIGHKQVLDTMKSQGGDMKIFVSQSQDPKKNPLDYPTKIKFIKEMFPEYAGNVVDNAGLNTVVKVASYLHSEGYNSATFVAGSDRLEDMKKLLTQYNGVEGKAHGFYKFEVLDFVSSGDREDGAEGVAGVSASGAREAAANNNFEKFKEATGAGELAKPLFAAVRKGMKISEGISEGSLNEFAPSGNSSSSYYAVTSNFVKEFIQQKQEELQDLIDAGWTKKDLAQAGTLKGHASDIEHLEQVRDGFLKGLKPGFDAYLQGDTQVKDQLGEYWMENDLPLNQDWEKIYGEPWGDDSEFNEGVTESPIEMDPSEPMNPMIHSHDKANPAKLKYRMLRAAGQLKDLASRAENASPGEWQLMARQFEELKMNMEQIRHALEELGKMRKKGGVRSRGIDPMVDSFKYPFAGEKVGQKAGREGQLKGTGPKEHPRNKLVGG